MGNFRRSLGGEFHTIGDTVAIECKWSQDAFDPTAMLAFRQRYPLGENVLVAADVKRASTRRVKGLEVHLVGLGHVAALVKRVAM